MLTQERLKQALHYDPETGEWTWLKALSYNVPAGQSAGTISVHGYRIITILGVKQRSSRLAWLYMTGSWPQGEMDHINRCKLDDRWDNLRVVSRSENALNRDLQSNNTSGARGVHWDAGRGKWFAQIRAEGVNFAIGRYDTLEEAVAARDLAAQDIHGDFATLNQKAS